MSGETKPDDATVINDAVDALTNLSVGDAAAGGDAGAAAGGSTAEGGGGAREEQQQQKPLKPLTDEQVDKIVKQVEFYFSDANLPTDAFLIKKVKADPTGFVPIGVVCSFNRMKTLLKKHPPIETVAAILREHSECLVVSDDGIRVRRTEPLPDIDLEDVQARTVVAENFKDQPTIESVMAQFSAAGDVAMVRVRHPGMQTQAGATKPSGLDLIATPSNAVHALIEFKTREDATKAAETLNDDKDWRNGLRVRLLVRNVHKKQKQQKQQRQKLDDEHGRRRRRRGRGGREGRERGGERVGGEKAARNVSRDGG
jgi:La-related protein 7